MCPYAQLTCLSAKHLLQCLLRGRPLVYLSIQKAASFLRLRPPHPRSLLCSPRILIEPQQRYRSNMLCQQCIKLTINKFKLHITLSPAISQVRGNKTQKHSTFWGFQILNSIMEKPPIQRLQRRCLSPAVAGGGSEENCSVLLKASAGMHKNNIYKADVQVIPECRNVQISQLNSVLLLENSSLLCCRAVLWWTRSTDSASPSSL